MPIISILVMEDISLINHRIKFHGGPRLDIWDYHNETYLVEFYEKIGNEWGLVKSFEHFGRFTFYHFYLKTFAVNWQIRISGWKDNKVVPLVIHTFTHQDKKILLEFKSDIFDDHKKWLEMSQKMKQDFNCDVVIVSKFYDRLTNDNVNVINEKPENYFDEFYSSFIIGKDNNMNQYQEIEAVSHYPELLKNPFANSGNVFYSCSHKTNPIKLNADELFNDIMNL